MITPSRRGFIAGLASLIAAPALVHASSLMPISSKNVPRIILPSRYFRVTSVEQTAEHYQFGSDARSFRSKLVLTEVYDPVWLKDGRADAFKNHAKQVPDFLITDRRANFILSTAHIPLYQIEMEVAGPALMAPGDIVAVGNDFEAKVRTG